MITGFLFGCVFCPLFLYVLLFSAPTVLDQTDDRSPLNPATHSVFCLIEGSQAQETSFKYSLPFFPTHEMLSLSSKSHELLVRCEMPPPFCNLNFSFPVMAEAFDAVPTLPPYYHTAFCPYIPRVSHFGQELTVASFVF